MYSLAPKSWSGPDDLSAEAWAGWAPEGLYFAFRVKDDIHVQPDSDSNLWHGDHMELQFDTLLEKDYTMPGMNEDDYQIGLSLGDFDKVPAVAYAWFNGPDIPGIVDSIQMANTVTDGGYILEVFIPKEALTDITLEEGAAFGMNISPSDTDLAGQGQKVMLSTSPIRTYADPKTFGKITLVK
ncbi:MAG: sugar-binding protein [Anaerolineales bacterium]